MNDYPETTEIKEIVTAAQKIVILQADNPDGDSLGSALALEEILGKLGKEPVLYCGADIPSYLHYLDGWDRITKDLPPQFDAAIIVDTSAVSLLENLQKTKQQGWLATKPVIVIDHHASEGTIPFAKVICNKPVVATAEVIYELVQQCGWPLNLNAQNMLVTAIMSDSLGLTVAATTARTFHIVGELVAGGVNIAALEQKRRELMRKSPELVHYKGELLERVEYHADNRIACVTIPWTEIQQYSPQYNPSMLVIDDMRMTANTAVAIAFKCYGDGHTTAKIRCNYGFGIASKIAEHFGGGGHIYASGFKVEKGRPFNELKSECIRFTTELLDTLNESQDHEAIQHQNT
jgi:bifunctional oligoribonuclease and PAP phosphatase NrnA